MSFWVISGDWHHEIMWIKISLLKGMFIAVIFCLYFEFYQRVRIDSLPGFLTGLPSLSRRIDSVFLFMAQILEILCERTWH
jgi:hypothetical protein